MEKADFQNVQIQTNRDVHLLLAGDGQPMTRAGHGQLQSNLPDFDEIRAPWGMLWLCSSSAVMSVGSGSVDFDLGFGL